jgi:hypothetical protein
MIPGQIGVPVPKSAWQRPENWVSAAPFIALGAVGLYYANPILEWVIELSQNILVAGGLLGVIAVVGFLATSADLHKVAGMAYTAFMKRLTNIVYTVYPLEIMEGYLEDLREKKTQLKKSLGELRGLLLEMINKLKQKGEEHTEAMRLAQVAHKRGTQKGMQAQVAFQARRATRLEKSGLTAQGRINKVKNLIALMEKVDEATDFMILDIEDTVKNEKEEREQAEKAAKFMKAAEAILFNNQKRAEFDKALEANQQYVSMQMGLLQQFEDDTKDILTGIDLENDMIQLEAVEKIDAMGKKLDGLFEGGSGATKYRVAPVFRIEGDDDEEAIQQQAELEQQEAEAPVKRQSYADLYDLKK